MYKISMRNTLYHELQKMTNPNKLWGFEGVYSNPHFVIFFVDYNIKYFILRIQMLLALHL
jgi:hypothetical protein